MKCKVAKFGGSSLADAEGFRLVRERLAEDPARRIVVVSAPGARWAGDPKVTDLLAAGDWAGVRRRFAAIAMALGLSCPQIAEESEPETAISRGEYYCARLMAEYLNWDFLDAGEVIVLDEHRNCRMEQTMARLRPALRGAWHVVMPGFYGCTTEGRILTFPRGGSDITGALAAAAADAAVYENFTDVNGVYTEDPASHPDARQLRQISYGGLHALARSGARVMHEDAILPVERAHIPMHILNTFRPDLEGTWVTDTAEDWED